MYEFDKYEKPRAVRSGLLPGDSYAPLREVAAASFLFWSEHCIECAEPACFQTCDLYQARPDGRCRRFTWGIARNRAFSSLRGYGAEISFKKWGKLESRGNAALMPRQRLLALERVFGWSAPILSAAGAILARVSGEARWRGLALRIFERTGRKLHRRARPDNRPDAFAVEVYNPAGGSVRLQVAMSVARNELGRTLDSMALLPSLRKTVELSPGYSRHEIPRSEFAVVTESGLPFDISLIPEADTDPTLVFLTADFVKFSTVSAAIPTSQIKLPPVKCVVWDLDNTVWNGILLENDAVRPEPGVIELIRALDERGVLASIASKNDSALALAKLTELGIAEYMLYPQINWMPKSESIKTIADKLNIGLDTFVFVDDNPFELDEVSRSLPMVTCINARDIDRIAKDPRFVGSATAEAKRRRSMYREAMDREQEEQKFGANLFGFLSSCEMKLSIRRYTPRYLDRVSELVQRTNQLNFSGHKYKREEIDPILTDPLLEKWVLECSDRFGSYGVVGFALTSRATERVQVEDFMLSCRVQGRFVEQAFFDALVRNDSERHQLWVNFNATGKNRPAQQVLAAIGFKEVAGESGMMLDLEDNDLRCDFIAVESDIGRAGSGSDQVRELVTSHGSASR